MSKARDAIIERETLMRDYLAAFKAVNTDVDYEIEIAYENGYFLMRQGIYKSKHRKKNVIAMLARLKARLNAPV